MACLVDPARCRKPHEQDVTYRALTGLEPPGVVRSVRRRVPGSVVLEGRLRPRRR
jgi:hypothetical protein